MEFKIPKKLIEVALPLDDINIASGREKSIRFGHPSTMHLWWARRPLAAARAILFAQLVNDPGYETGRGFTRGVNKREAERLRENLFQIIRDLVVWENTNNVGVIERARAEIQKSWEETCRLNKNHPLASELFDPEILPAFHDPFAGGGALPLEAMRLGLVSYATDLNPVPVLLNKVMLELSQKFSNITPKGPSRFATEQPGLMQDRRNLAGLAEDVSRYGKLLNEAVLNKIGELYPSYYVENSDSREALRPYQGSYLTPIAFLWTRTIESPSPAFAGKHVPLMSSYVLSAKTGKECWLEVKVTGGDYSFELVDSKFPKEAKDGSKINRGNFKCVLSDSIITSAYIKEMAKKGRLGQKIVAVVAEGKRERVYLPPTAGMEDLVSSLRPHWTPDVEISGYSQYIGPTGYGMTKFSDLFNNRQLVAINAFCDEIINLRDVIYSEAQSDEYANIVTTYLSFTLSKCLNLWSTCTSWMSDRGAFRETFARQAIPIVWDYAEANPFSNSGGNFVTTLDKVVKAIEYLPMGEGHVYQMDAASQSVSTHKVISTDPPYYDNIPYADLSDYFYVWLRRLLKPVYPDIFATLTTPKDSELVAFKHRHASKEAAAEFFLSGMTQAMVQLSQQAHPAFPVTIYYAFKQTETVQSGTASTGWETFLEAVVSAGFVITGTWPVRTEGSGRIRATGANALASSIVLVCQKRDGSLGPISRREFLTELRTVMPDALEAMIGGESGNAPIAPVDLAQSAIGPGMAVFSRYGSIINQDGTHMSVHDALVQINRAISEYLNPDSVGFDSDTLFCTEWFSQFGWATGGFGEADTLAKAKDTSVGGLTAAAVIISGGGKVKLLKWTEYPSDWDPRADDRTPVWEACHQLIRVLNQQGETAAGVLLARMPEQGEPIRQLAYHLYTLCERKKWAEDARAYNSLIGSWHAIVAASHEAGHKDEQIGLEF